MKYPFSKEEFLMVQDKLYDEIEKQFNENRLSNFDFKLVEEESLWRLEDDKNIGTKLYYWIKEIRELKSNIYEELILSLSYDRIYGKLESPLRGTIKFINRERYFRIALNDLVSLLDKIAYLIFQMFDNKIKYVEGNSCKTMNPKKVNIYSISNGLANFNLKVQGVTWINDIELNLVKDILNELNSNKKISNLKNVRNKFTHQSNPGIDCFSSEYLTSPQWGKIFKNDYLSRSDIEDIRSLEKGNCKFEEVSKDAIEVWNILIDGLERLIKNITILDKHIIKYY